MKIAITGASGHIGNNLIRRLLKDDHKISAMYHTNTDSLEDLDVEKVQGDVFDPTSLDAFFKGKDIVFHLASEVNISNDKHVLDVNISSCRNVLKACKDNKIKRLVHFSSIHALTARPLDAPMDETRPLCVTDSMIYDRSKAVSEQMVLDACADLDAVVVNPTGVMGPFDFRPGPVGKALISIYNNALPALVKGGFNWVDVRDVAAGAVAAMEKGRRGERYILGGKHYTTKAMADIVTEQYGVKTPGLVLPLWLAWLGLPFISLYAAVTRTPKLYTGFSLHTIRYGHTGISVDKARQELGYEPRPFSETVRDTLKWFLDNRYIGAKN